jgi:hypothetical protein
MRQVRLKNLKIGAIVYDTDDPKKRIRFRFSGKGMDKATGETVYYLKPLTSKPVPYGIGKYGCCAFYDDPGSLWYAEK